MKLHVQVLAQHVLASVCLVVRIMDLILLGFEAVVESAPLASGRDHNRTFTFPVSVGAVSNTSDFQVVMVHGMEVLPTVSASKSVIPVCQALFLLCKQESFALGCLILHLLFCVPRQLSWDMSKPRGF